MDSSMAESITIWLASLSPGQPPTAAPRDLLTATPVAVTTASSRWLRRSAVSSVHRCMPEGAAIVGDGVERSGRARLVAVVAPSLGFAVPLWGTAPMTPLPAAPAWSTSPTPFSGPFLES